LKRAAQLGKTASMGSFLGASMTENGGLLAADD
jgi:hypothetical protein